MTKQSNYMDSSMQARIRATYPDYKTAAEAIGITPQHLSRVINHKQKISDGLLRRLDAALPTVVMQNDLPDMEWLQRSVVLLVAEAYNRGVRSVVTLKQLEENRTQEPKDV